MKKKEVAGIRIKYFFISSIAVLMAFLGASVHALPEDDVNKHLGVASCSSNVCHGKGRADKNENVQMDEYLIWSTEDPHSRAYKILFNEESKRIARNMGLNAAHKAKICLDCHADNVAQASRGPKFQLNDGVGCEGCHGGSEQWIESHTEDNATHADNLRRGMYPTEDGVARAKLCLSCHYGTKNKLATHEIMGAGHPRLSFELETFTANQPAHYTVDADYKQRKGDFTGFNVWVIGQLESVKSSLSLMREYLINKNSFIPELFFYDCHACHHPMSDIRWAPTSTKAGMPPGMIRLSDANFLMLLETTQVLAPQQTRTLKQAIIGMHKASMSGRTRLQQALSRLDGIVAGLESLLVQGNYSTAQIKQVRARLLTQAAAGEYRDFSAAEQAFLAIESITLALQQGDALNRQLDSLYNTLDDQDRFSPRQFRSTARRVKSAFN